jgi:hypothetical protein
MLQAVQFGRISKIQNVLITTNWFGQANDYPLANAIFNHLPVRV